MKSKNKKTNKKKNLGKVNEKKIEKLDDESVKIKNGYNPKKLKKLKKIQVID